MDPPSKSKYTSISLSQIVPRHLSDYFHSREFDGKHDSSEVFKSDDKNVQQVSSCEQPPSLPLRRRRRRRRRRPSRRSLRVATIDTRGPRSAQGELEDQPYNSNSFGIGRFFAPAILFLETKEILQLLSLAHNPVIRFRHSNCNILTFSSSPILVMVN